MVHIHIITLGKLKESYWQEAEAEYLKRLQPFAKVTIHELREETFGEKDKPEIVKEKEAVKLKKEIEKLRDAYIVVLDENGRQYASVQFAEQLSDRATEQPNLVFILGGPLGLDKSITNVADSVLSLSQMTFTHQMARVILLEQVYRAMMIANNRKYHY